MVSWAHWILSKNYRGLCHVGCLINRAYKEIAARQSEVGARVRGCFRALKKSLCQSPMLSNPDFDKQFILQTDAPDRAGAVLSQLDDNRKIKH